MVIWLRFVNFRAMLKWVCSRAFEVWCEWVCFYRYHLPIANGHRNQRPKLGSTTLRIFLSRMISDYPSVAMNFIFGS